MLQHQGDMPRIYFYLSGKSVPLNAIGGCGSPVGTKWIILNLLQEEHYIVGAATSASTNSLRRSLAEMQELPAALQLWTGGSPRLLVYSLRVLHHLLNEGNEFIAEQAMEAVFHILKDQPAVASEVFLAKKDEAEWQQTWLYLILLAQLRVPCQRETILPVGSAEHSLDLLLGRLNIYISKPEQPINGMSDAFYICHMKMIDQFVRKRYASDCRVQLFLGDEGTIVQDEDLLEHMVAQRIVVQACLHPQGSLPSWGDVMKPLLQGTKAEQLEAKLDQGCPLSSFSKVTASAQPLQMDTSPLDQRLLRPQDLAAAMQSLDSGRLYRPGPKSSSADLVIKHSKLTIEVQDISGVSTGVSFADVCQEVGKCIQQGSVLWVLVALKLNKSLSHWVGEARPLVLESGTYQQEKLADGGSGGLLFRVKSKGEWQKRIQHGEWHDVTTKIQPQGKGETLQVRPGLQLVIPHPKHVEEFLGESDFEIVKELAQKSRDRTVDDIPFLSRFYNFRQPPAQGTSEERLLVEQFVSVSELMCEVLAG
ncbi:unnamed protein product [Symbiodinium sp. CCMP2592]|nr:unnamed protein product [Symbiodinium sp. CCMP2592]